MFIKKMGQDKDRSQKYHKRNLSNLLRDSKRQIVASSSEIKRDLHYKSRM